MLVHNILVVGTGYVGLVSGACFSEIGYNVTCIDHDKDKIESLKNGKMPIYEPGLEDIVHRNVHNKTLFFSTSLKDHINNNDVVIIAVGTPTNDVDGSTYLSFVFSVVDEIIKYLSKDILVIIKSTVPPGTCDLIQKKFDDSALEYKCHVISNPEFLREGNAIKDFMSPDRVVVGCDAAINSFMSELYSDHIKRGIKFITTNRVTAELIKYSANTFLAAKVAFINEISSISERINSNILDLKDGIGSDSRIGYKFLEPGPGFGGSCFPKDINSLIHFSNNIQSNNAIIRSVIESNKNRIQEISENIENFIESGDTICVLGLTYKANTDDVRTSPAIGVIEKLLEKGKYLINCYDPMGVDSAKNILKDKVKYFEDIYEAAAAAAVVVIATEWDEFKKLNSEVLKTKMKTPKIYDLRGIINTHDFKKSGFQVKVVGFKNA